MNWDTACSQRKAAEWCRALAIDRGKGKTTIPSCSFGLQKHTILACRYRYNKHTCQLLSFISTESKAWWGNPWLELCTNGYNFRWGHEAQKKKRRKEYWDARRREVRQIRYGKKQVKATSSACSFGTREQGYRQRKGKKFEFHKKGIHNLRNNGYF